jgi:hypothetical protein
MVLRYPLQISFHVAVQDEIGILQRRVVYQPVKLRALVHILGVLVLYGDGVNGEHGSVRIEQFHTVGVHVELAGNQAFHKASNIMKDFGGIVSVGLMACVFIL